MGRSPVATEETMKHGKLLRVGGFLSGGVLMLFGIAVIALGIWAFSTLELVT
jgi:hypothetical protein